MAVVEGLRTGAGKRRHGMRVIIERRRSPKLGNRIHDTHTLAESRDTELGLQHIGIQIEEHIASDLLL